MLYGMCASGRDLAPAGVRDSVVALVRAHWGLGLKALTGAFVTDPTAEDVAAFTRFQRASAAAAVAARLLEVYYDTDIRALLPAIEARTAVLHRKADKGTRFELGAPSRLADPGGDADPAAGFQPPVLPRRLAGGPGGGARFLVLAASPGPRLTGRELRGGRTDRRGADQSRHRQSPVRRAAHGGGARGEHPAQAAGALACPDRDVGDRAPGPSAVERLGSSPAVRAGITAPARGGGGLPVVHPIAAPGRAVVASRHVTCHEAGPPSGGRARPCTEFQATHLKETT